MDQVHYLQFQVVAFDETIELIANSINKVGKRLVKQYFRKWIHVSNLNEINAKIIEMDGERIFVSDTSQYLPCWLHEGRIEYSDQFIEIPEDEPLTYGPKMEQEYGDDA